MKDTQKELIKILIELWVEAPELRFGQLLTAVNVLEFANTSSPEAENFNLRDVFMDEDDDILKTIKTSNFYFKHEEKKNK